MAMLIKQSTSIDIAVGPFLDDSNGVTAETALSITQPDIRLKKNGGNWAQKAASQTLTHEEAGWYELTLDSTDTNTLGQLMVAIAVSGALPVWREFEVISANAYDSLVAGTDVLQADVTQFNGTNGTFASGRPDVNTTHFAGSALSATTAHFGVNVVNLGNTTVDASGGLINANMKQVSADATAADNLEAMLDGSGGVSLTCTFVGNQTGNVSGSVGSVSGAVASVTGNVGGNVVGSVASVSAGVTLAADSVNSSALAATAVAEILAATIGDGTTTIAQALRILVAGIAGKLSGAATTTVTIRNLADTANVIVATVDTNGNRSAVTVTP